MTLATRLIIVLVSLLLISTTVFAQSDRSNRKRDHDKSVTTDQVYYLIPVDIADDDRYKDKDKDKDKDNSNTASIKGDSRVSSIDSSGTTAITDSRVMGPPGGGGGGGGEGGGGGSGQDPHHETYARQHIREDVTQYGVDLMGEQFDLGTGTLSFSHVDVSIPGNSGLEVAIRRVINTAQGNFQPVNEFADWELDVPKLEMMVSTQGGNWHSDRCTANSDPGDIYFLGSWYHNYEYWNGLKMHIPGQGTQFVLDNPSAPNKTGGGVEKSTTQYWEIECANVGSSETFIATSPSGIKYHFDKLRYLPAFGVEKDFKILSRNRAQMLATKVEDRFGNWVQYNYTGDDLTSITSSDGRTITLTYNGSGFISRVTANGRHWDYSYVSPSGTSYSFLTEVELPTDESWLIDFDELILAELDGSLGLRLICTQHGRETATGTITHPHGAKGTYTITETSHGRTDVPNHTNLSPPPCAESKHMQRSFDVLSLTQKKIEGPGLTTMTWDYTYSENQGGWAGDGTNPLKTTRVDKPDGSYDIHHFDRSWTYREGSLVKHETFSDTGTLLQKVEYDYESGPSRGYYGEVFYENLAKNLSPKHQIEVVTTRGTDVYTTEYDFDTVKTSPTFSYGKPLQIDQSNSFSSYSQVVDIAYDHDLTNWEIGRETTRKVGSEVLSENHYDSNNRVQYVDSYGVQVAEYSYNSDGTVAWQKDALGNKTTLASWKRGIPRTITYPNNKSHLFGVNDRGFIHKSTDRKGYVTDYTHDDLGRLTSVNYPDESGSTRDNKTLDLIEVTTANDGLSGSGIAVGQWKHKVTRGELEVTTYLDALFRPVLTRSRDTTDSSLDRFTRSSFDHHGQATFTSFPSATVAATDGTDYENDALGRPLEIEENVTPYATTSYEYLNGNKIRVTNPRNKKVTTTYYALGSPAQDLPTQIDQAEGISTQVSRNDFGEMTQAKQYGGSPYVTVTRDYKYDSSHRLCRQVDPESGSTVYSYNAAGQIDWYALAASGSTGACNTGSVLAGEKITHSYNNMNQLTAVNYPDSSPDLAYTYDDNGNLKTLNSSSANWTYSYNKLNALTQETLVTNGQTFTTDYDFDTQDRLTDMDYPSGLSLSITPNAYGEPESVGSYASGIEYHPNGSIKALTYGNSRVYTTTQNDRQLPLELKIADGSSNIAKLTHYYDANANITSITDSVTPAANRSMTYDNVDRLKTASGIWGSGSYSYDVIGNIKTKNEGSDSISITYDSDNLVDDVVINSTTRSYMHDAYGNVTNNGNQTFTYNLAGNMVTSSSPSITNYYDGHKRRVRVKEGSNNEYNMYSQGGTLLHKKDGGVETDYIYAGSLLIAKKEGSNVHYLHTDLLGSPIDGKVGSTSYTENYSPWGEKLDNPIQLSDDVGYTGHQSDVATGLTYMQARYYDPVIGRFMAVDPVMFNGDNPSVFGRYVYAKNNPIKYLDPDGRDAVVAGNYIQINPSNPSAPSVSIPNSVGASGFSNVGSDPSTHSYTVRTQASATDPAAVGKATRDNPTPGNDKPASKFGITNDVGSLPTADAPNLVMSFSVDSPDPTKFTDITVNYTVDGAHGMAEGFVMKYGEVKNGQVQSHVSYGEGNAIRQSNMFKAIWGSAVKKVWTENHQEIDSAAQ